MVRKMAGAALRRSWKIGELARATGLAIGALRHYEAIGLLARERRESGQRRYRERDVRRLHQVLAFRQLGLPLHEIADSLDSRSFDARELVRRQLDDLDRRRGDLVPHDTTEDRPESDPSRRILSGGRRFEGSGPKTEETA